VALAPLNLKNLIEEINFPETGEKGICNGDYYKLPKSAHLKTIQRIVPLLLQ
jgi:hypothetical protein